MLTVDLVLEHLNNPHIVECGLCARMNLFSSGSLLVCILALIQYLTGILLCFDSVSVALSDCFVHYKIVTQKLAPPYIVAKQGYHSGEIVLLF
jgi:hypothetical protein